MCPFDNQQMCKLANMQMSVRQLIQIQEIKEVLGIKKKNMENILKYKDFTGSVCYNNDDKVFHGKIEFITDLVTFQGTNLTELEAAFPKAVEGYIKLRYTLNNRDAVQARHDNKVIIPANLICTFTHLHICTFSLLHIY